MITSHWPLFGLRVATPRLELRLPTLEELAELADLAAEGVHDPAMMPFREPWTDAEPALRARGVLQYHWKQWGTWTPEDWSLNFVVFHDGVVVGTQKLGARNFAILREVSTASWLGRRHHGRGIGTEMRAAVLHFAFAGLGAEQATTGAFRDNAASWGVSRKLGYQADGIARLVVRGQPVVERRLRLDRVDWEAHHGISVEISGLEPCLPLFGLSC